MTELLTNILFAIWTVLGEMSPYLLFGFLVAGILSVFISPEKVEKHLGKRGFKSILKATLFGIPLPLCSCGVIPVASSLRKHGASRGATTSFLLSTPQTGVDSILVTYSLLGGIFAIFRPLIALVSGLVGGLAADLSNKDDEENHIKCEDECCHKDGGGVKGNRAIRALRYGFVTLPGDIAGALLIGLVVAGIISALVPANYFADILGGGVMSMFVMMIIGLPLYVCATASVPIAASLINAGVSPGAVFAFLMTGPATNAATIAVVWKLMGKRTAITYLSTVVVFAVSGGLLLDYIFSIAQSTAGTSAPWMVPVWIKTCSSIVLLVILTLSFLRKGVFSCQH